MLTMEPSLSVAAVDVAFAAFGAAVVAVNVAVAAVEVAVAVAITATVVAAAVAALAAVVPDKLVKHSKNEHVLLLTRTPPFAIIPHLLQTWPSGKRLTVNLNRDAKRSL